MVRAAAAALVAAAGLSVSAGCSSGGDDDEAAPSLTVFAAASLAGAFDEIAEDFEQAHPGVRVRLAFDGSSGLVDQLEGGAPADVFASADEPTMDRAVAAGLTAGPPSVFATGELTLITPAGNPAGITGLDSSLDGRKLVVCADGVPCGTATRLLAGRAGVDLRPVSEESSVTDVRGKVASGEADVGIVYATDALALGDAVERIALPASTQVLNRYPVAVLAGAGEPELAARFTDMVLGPQGRAVLGTYGFGAP